MMAYNQHLVYVIALFATISVTSVAAQEVYRLENIPGKERREVYEHGTWTVAYVPEARSGSEIPYGQKYHILQPNQQYRLDPSQSQSNYCFMVSHYSDDFVSQASYLGVATFSILEQRTNPLRPVSMFRNSGWARNNKLESRIQTSPLRPEEFFIFHSDPLSLEALDKSLDFPWHAQYGENTNDHSWRYSDLWNLSRKFDTELIFSLGGSGWEDTRFDGKLIRFVFTQSRQSRKPPRFCIERQSRLATVLTLSSPHLPSTLEFIIIE